MRDNPVKRKLSAGDTALGTMIFEFFTPGTSAIVGLAGAEFCLFDMEHTGASLETIRAMIGWCRATAVVPMVRVPAHEYRYVAGALDAGAQGIMFPNVETAEQARELVSFTRYPPVGRRGAAFGVAHDEYRGGGADQVIETMRRANAELLNICQIESAEGVRNVEQILAVDGVDVAWVGHGDLSIAMGQPYQFDHPEHLAALDRVATAAASVGKIAGRQVTDPASGQEMLRRGYRMLSYGPDSALLRRALADGLGALRRSADGGAAR